MSISMGLAVIARSRDTGKIEGWIYDADTLMSVILNDLESCQEDYLAQFEINWGDMSPEMQTTLRMIDRMDEDRQLTDFLGRLVGDVANAIEALMMGRVLEAVRRIQMPDQKP